MPFDLTGKAVTQAGSCMGKAITTQLAQQGVNVCLFDLNNDVIFSASKEINDASAEAIVYNVLNLAEVIEVSGKIAQEFNHPDEVAFITGTGHPLDRGFIRLNT